MTCLATSPDPARERGRPLPEPTDGSARGDVPPASRRAPGRSVATRSRHTRNRMGSSGNSAASAERSAADRRGSIPPTAEQAADRESLRASAGRQSIPCPVQSGAQVATARRGRGRCGPHDDIDPGPEPLQACAAQLPQSPLDAIAHDRVADGRGYDETHSTRGVPAVGRTQGVHDEQARPVTAGAGAAHDRGELGWGPQPMGGRQHDRRRQADSSARPLRRRAAMIARPARVLIRWRKPCVLARRRLLGWKVRLLTLVHFR